MIPRASCTFRPFRAGDEDSLVIQANDPAVAQNLRDAFPQPYTRADADGWIAFAGSESGARLHRAIVVDGALAGAVGVTPQARLGVVPYSPAVKLRPFVAGVLVLGLVTEMPVTARAQVVTDAPAIMTHVVPILPVPGSLDGTLDVALQPGQGAIPASFRLFAPGPQDMRLSHGAKVAIIVSAIVVGSLIVLGLVVFSRPGHI